ncbi:MAG TPA: monovalent cation/H(+) antiporter subunit G [Acetobacteraceae bacterium]|nr:monovalent cation/H(+) antiporter subunit G [Acetobacteraceae bacterium]
MSVVSDLLLAAATLSAWLACLGFARLRGALDRLHCATFAAATVGPAVLVAAFASQGGSPSVAKVVFLLACLLLSGAALSHAIGRALIWRDQHGGEP